MRDATRKVVAVSAGVSSPSIKGEDTVEIDVAEHHHTIRHSMEALDPSLEFLQSTIDRSELEEETVALETGDAFEIQSLNPLRIVPNEMMLLHLTDQ
ncbi:hypothetical protein NGM10_17880 (plasmid) [Halorussus salilacus]|uniref:hypothetical protein n=1 Tax=Halorussus salilacus TaxID=2953750 RepID=UPI00209CF4BD|nr:hypothetical protein [Halorussus salilacus]USZ70163.1 hypothetical protein NGM10_17880 [Halorussus salilacus]